jgi:uncharacterized membrane protein (TIGR02234 family)
VSPRTELRLALGGCVAAGATILFSAGRDWYVAHLAFGRVATTGHDAARSLTTWGLVALAGVVAIAATRRWGRVPVGVALAASGVAVVVVCAPLLSPDTEPRLSREPTASVRVPTGAKATAWPYVCASAGVLLAASGLLVAVRGPRWPALGARYDAPAARPRTDADVWDALDRGEDPTA